jgi:hypothetical protein
VGDAVVTEGYAPGHATVVKTMQATISESREGTSIFRFVARKIYRGTVMDG